LSETTRKIIVLNDTYNEKKIDSDSGEIRFSKSQYSDNLDKYDLIILFSNAIPDGDNNTYEEIIRREREISNAIVKGRQFYVLVYETNNYFFKRILA
jgi:hypothetical protein